MIDQDTFERIKTKHGHYASWAVWAEVGNKPKSNVGDLSIFEPKENHGLLEQLNPNFVLVCLNISRGIQFPCFGNFHDGRGKSQDFKIRYALTGTILWGAYMTDIIKNVEQKSSKELTAYLRQHPSAVSEIVEQFTDELSDLGVKQPTLVAFGGDVHEILSKSRNLSGRYDIWPAPHFSSYMSKENYRKGIAEIVERKAGPSGFRVGHG